MLGRLIGRKKPSEGNSERGSAEDDEAIIHLSVPDEVLYPDRPAPSAADMSWLDSGGATETKLPPSRPEAATGSVETAPIAPARHVARVKPVPSTGRGIEQVPVQARFPELVPNDSTEGRPRYPYGWLVVVEGPGTGEWFPLERGRTQIGRAPGQTVQLDFGDEGIAADCHAELGYDEERHGFVVKSDVGLRVNGVERSGATSLRDGDVFTMAGTSVRLVALCSQNFHWAEHIAAE